MIYLNIKQHQEFKHIEKEMVPLNADTLCSSESTEALNETSVNISTQFIVQENNNISASLDNNFEHISVNSRIEATKFEPETTFEITINNVKYNRLKIITSIDMNLSDITSKKRSLFYEHLKDNLMPCIVLQSPVKSPQFIKYFSSMHPRGNTQLQTRKWWVTLISAFYLYFFGQTFSITLNKQHYMSNR